MRANIKRNEQRRVVVVGGGLGGLKLVSSLRDTDFQVVLVDKNNYNQFPPLIYQVASAGLEPSNISFPFRRLFQGWKNFFFRMAEVQHIDTEEKAIKTSIGTIHYDDLVLAAGATTNFFGNKNIEASALPMKSVSESMRLRNTILQNLERAETEDNEARKQALMNIAIVGGGPSGVEIAGVLAEMKQTILPRDYPDLDTSCMHIYLINATPRLLGAMSERSSREAERALKELGVEVMTNCMVTDYVDKELVLKDGQRISAETVIWVSGIKANNIDGIPTESIGHAGRILVDRFNRVKGLKDVYAIGDQCIVEGDEAYPYGHPQLAQVAIQQAKTLAKNLIRQEKGETEQPFSYHNLGTMATIGRKKAVVEIGKLKFGGFFAWLLWLIVHLRSILGVKNKTIVFLNWMWSYMNYKQSLRLILKAKR
ncbi:NAD(P)/FAD-dependent oxidoreductase [Segatella salivae]|uniref:NADH:ubiquinone reductase (non-electrogenic) n=1 Tax=Segatella salivae TaxID=228604 RepID=A0AAW4NQL3_9BACT|nr:NAD(P)/FAD-dependent oxidoreductase [Segatella salivae]MBF1552021.1 NAD(P)/FAD-dependent oxidoreductase [Segatella salivae]MBW4865760.1 NAD(P)/FAD-dependent oxidoreductase [Segatella salivae]MBW4907706.1 NAD(P)/FAD-dependent oxidoreductase [Segatella salivae]MBW4909920.1 NAD(P)/FAD-dependent oxidoreductase [Segatella salivae]